MPDFMKGSNRPSSWTSKGHQEQRCKFQAVRNNCFLGRKLLVGQIQIKGLTMLQKVTYAFPFAKISLGEYWVSAMCQSLCEHNMWGA